MSMRLKPQNHSEMGMYHPTGSRPTSRTGQRVKSEERGFRFVFVFVCPLVWWRVHVVECACGGSLADTGFVWKLRM